MFKYIPNILTIIRFLLIPFIIVLALNESYLYAILILTISSLTDILDGYIARHYNLVSDFGKLMDPLADKATQITIIATLSIQKIIPLWILLITLTKEFIMIAGASFLYGKELVVSSKWYGKLSTVSLYISLVASLFILYWNFTLIEVLRYELPILPHFDTYLYGISITLTLFSLLMYIKSFFVQGYLKSNAK